LLNSLQPPSKWSSKIISYK